MEWDGGRTHWKSKSFIWIVRDQIVKKRLRASLSNVYLYALRKDKLSEVFQRTKENKNK